MFGMNKNKKGFTIIELIVVIAIIAVLAGIVLVNVQQYILKSKLAAAKADMKQLQTLSAKWVDAGNTSFNNFCDTQTPDFEHAIYYSLRAMGFLSGAPYTYNFYTFSINQAAHCIANINCDGKWYAILWNVNDNTPVYCVDSAGGINETIGNANTCACQ